jgi:phosphoglycerol transferase MdoB-like AlkP superfamily enzyme
MSIKSNDLSRKDRVAYFLFFSIPLISLFMIEFAARDSISSTITWPVAEPFAFFASVVLFYAVYVFLWVNIYYQGITALVYSIIFIVFSCITGCKKEVLGLPFMPWDIKSGHSFSELFGCLSLFQLKFLTNWIFILLVAINIFVIVMIFLHHAKTSYSRRISNITTIVCIALIAGVFFTLPKVSIADSNSVYQKDGYVRGFIISTQLWLKTNDSTANGTASAESGSSYQFTERKAATDLKPNVIFIMSESFFDITELPHLTFSEDPLPNLHALMKSNVSGKMVSNTFGGTTDNVEFEIMTGFSLKYLPFGTNPYETCINKPIPSLPSYFKGLGYQTIAIHPNICNFFNRNKVYPLLGFDRFVSSENMPDAKIKGAYISDDTFADYIISEYKQAKRPVFMYNISMQNHWPYITKNYYKKYDITVKSSVDLDRDSITALQNYTQGVHDADASLKKITDYFETVKEPTVIVFLGDHLPSLTDNLGVYKKLGYVDKSLANPHGYVADKTTEEMVLQNKKIMETPYLIWTNYSTDKGKDMTLSSNYLGVYVLSRIGLGLPPFYNFLIDYSNKLPINSYFLTITQNGMPFIGTPSAYDSYENAYMQVQNDMLLGKQNEWDLFQTK